MFGLVNKAFGAITGLQKALFIVEYVPIPVQFNPNSYKFSQRATNKKDKCDPSKEPQFTGIDRDDFTLELFFDSYEAGLDVRLNPSYIAIKAAMHPGMPGAKKMKQKRVAFAWDALGTESNGVIFEGYITKLEQKFTLFLGDGTPVRAVVTITIRDSPYITKKLKDLGYFGCRKVRTIQEGERLDLLANRTLFDPTLWREIVNENPELIDNPRSYPRKDLAGETVMIPDYYDEEGA